MLKLQAQLIDDDTSRSRIECSVGLVTYNILVLLYKHNVFGTSRRTVRSNHSGLCFEWEFTFKSRASCDTHTNMNRECQCGLKFKPISTVFTDSSEADLTP